MFRSTYRSSLSILMLVALATLACSAAESENGPASATDSQTLPTATATPTPTTASTPALTPTPDSNESQSLPDGPRQLMESLLERSVLQVVEEMGESGNSTYVPVLVDLLGVRSHPDLRKAVEASLVRLTGEAENPDWRWWAEWLSVRSEIQAPEGYAAWKGQLYSLIDPVMGSFLYEGVKRRIRLEEIVWGGVPTDGIPDLRYAPVLPAAEAAHVLPNDRVFGVSMNGEHRAYPLRILNAHEMANDIVGGVPFALAY